MIVCIYKLIIDWTVFMVYEIRTDGMAFVNGPGMAFDSTVFMDYETRTDETKLVNGAEFRPQYCSTHDFCSYTFMYISYETSISFHPTSCDILCICHPVIGKTYLSYFTL